MTDVYAQTTSGNPRRDWRVTMALTSTALWLLLGFSYIALQIGWQSFVGQPVGALGGFLGGSRELRARGGGIGRIYDLICELDGEGDDGS